MHQNSMHQREREIVYTIFDDQNNTKQCIYIYMYIYTCNYDHVLPSLISVTL